MPLHRSEDSKNNTLKVADVLAGDFRTIARLVSLIEDESPEAQPFLKELFPQAGRCLSIGITGAPGSGKSTLVDKLATHYRDADKKVGIIAVDPSSPFTGGAILGDRIRMRSRSLDPGTFIRSMATRGNLGGLSRSTADVLMVLDAAGFDIVLIETVGVGQDETEIVRTARATLLLLVPGSGDEIQTMKAGIMEIADIFIINKADRPEVDRFEAELRSLVSMSSRADGWEPRIYRTVASAGEGIEACVQGIEAYRKFLASKSSNPAKNLEGHKQRILDLARSQLTRRFLEDAATAQKLEQLALAISDLRTDPFSAAEELLEFVGLRRIEKRE